MVVVVEVVPEVRLAVVVVGRGTAGSSVVSMDPVDVWTSEEVIVPHLVRMTEMGAESFGTGSQTW